MTLAELARAGGRSEVRPPGAPGGRAIVGDLLVLALFSGLFLGLACFLSHRKLLWTDELLTFYLSGLPTAADVWSAHVDGPEAFPPLAAYATRAAFALLGRTHVAARLPAVLGFWLMCACLYAFARRRCGRATAAIAMIAPLTTAAFAYAYEARPYGLMVGFAAAALLCWQAAGEGRARPAALVGLAAALFAAVSAHWYAVLVLAPLGLAEAARTRGRGRPDWAVWVALAAGLGPFAAFWPVLANARSHTFLSYYNSLDPMALIGIYDGLVRPASLVLLAFAATAALAAPGRAGAEGAGRPAGGARFPAHEVVAAAGFAAIPALGALLAAFATGFLTLRYVLPAVIGLAVLAAALADRLARGRRLVAAALLGAVVLGAAYHAATSKLALLERSAVASRSGQFALIGLAGALGEAGPPIVVSDVHTYFYLKHYAPAPLAGRIVFVTGFDNHGSYMMRRLAPWVPWRVVDRDEFLRETKSFYVYDRSHYPLVAALLSRGGRLSDDGYLDGRDVFPRPGYLYRVSFERDGRPRVAGLDPPPRTPGR